MATSSKSNVSGGMDPIANYLSMHTLRAVEQFDQESNENDNCCNDKCCSCFNNWWNVKFNHQRFIVHIVEKTAFHLAIIILVLIDCLLVVSELLLDFIYLSQQCDNKAKNTTHNGEVENHKLKLAIELLHYASIVLLAIFVVEVTIKIYAFGKKWWNFRGRKMEWLDALIVIVSFAIDIYFLKKPSVIAEISLLFISFRLWRIIRIINSVAQSIRSQDESAKKNLANTYLQVIELLLNVSTKKTDVTSELRHELTRENFDKIIEKFTSIDQTCRTVLTQCQKPSSRNAITDIAQGLQETVEQIRLTSSTLGITNKKK
ncbi:unnamed protein product [Rotaria sordida]|uniref:Voltage-gated hydrogen channel 1 n=2 Tax=Rotaria sordida TaxID=392033 RepID=A0A814G267_9BILA|nr:unnamed protein product [Rotaria sordida]CAF1075423.1 unnamed protein product [Rotaria sordida]CAF1108241.1 unnamed protein product [Rotaria sordida]CAF3597556.1 unnamed protein product [Rotaria sordida]CAF3686066.1 unnamed protein product [Rotaria sordida]